MSPESAFQSQSLPGFRTCRTHRLHFFGRCAKSWRDDAVGPLDVAPAVDAQLGDEHAEERLGLLGLALREDVLQLIGDGCQIRAAQFFHRLRVGRA
jgi:hypothetical protein